MASVKTFHEQLLVPLASSATSHKIIQLPNGLLVLLISDPSEDLASIALSVAAGAHNDPNGILGLAHFCEHLLLLGSKNYSNPNEFHDSLTRNGGRRNAFTTGEKTCYFFEIPSSSTHKVNNIDEPVFNHLIEMFADCFKNPLFNESMFEKEIYAIDNEHTANKSSSGRLLYHGLRLISNQEHPFHRFATGNFFTLNDLPKFKKLKVRNQLMDYFKDNYVAENMGLVIRSSQSLNLLTKLVMQNFSDLPSSLSNKKKPKMKLFGKSSSSEDSLTFFDTNKELSDFNILSKWNYDSKAFNKDEAQTCIFINSSNNPTLRLVFPYDEIMAPDSRLLINCWSNIVGDEGEGSLDQYLKDKGYSVGLSAFSQNLSRGSSVLVIEINLTTTGIKNIPSIIPMILNTYKSSVFSNVKELARVLFELESIDLLNYLHQDTTNSPMDEASRYSQNLLLDMKSLNPKNILKGSSNWDSQNNLGTTKGNLFWYNKGEQLFNFVKESFTMDNLRFAVLGDLKVISGNLDSFLVKKIEETDQYFGFNYTLGRFDKSSFSESQENVTFQLIQKNPFIPSYALDQPKLQKLLLVSSKKSSEAALSFVTKSAWSSTTAQLHSKTSTAEIWTKVEPSKIFDSKLFISFDVILTNIEASPEKTMMAEIFTELLKLKISKKLYCSELLNYTWEIQASLKGDLRFGFTFSGYNEGIGILLNLMIDEFLYLCRDGSFSLDQFRKSRVAVRSRYSELDQNNSLSMAISGLLVVLEQDMWTLEDRLDALDDINFDSFTSFFKDFEKYDKFTKIFIQGNVQEIASINGSINKLSHHLEKLTKNINFKEPSTYSIQSGKSYKIERKGAKNDPMNSISYFIETGPRNDYYTQQMTKLFSYLMSLTLVPDLRFKKQLGYAVLGGTRILRTTFGIHISIMSGTFTPQYLQDKIDEYLSTWETSYSNMTDTEFQTTVIEQYLTNFKIDLTKGGGPESLTADIPSSASSSNANDVGESMKLHKLIRDQISTESYDVKTNDQDFLKKVTRLEFLKFFQQKISNKFNSRSQLSVMIKSQLSAAETQQQLIQLQLEAFLKMNGLRISSEKLKEIVQNTNGNPVFLLKDLFKYFISQGESFKLCTIVLKEVVKQVFESLKHYKLNYSDSTSKDSCKSEQIECIEDFHKQNKIYYIT